MQSTAAIRGAWHLWLMGQLGSTAKHGCAQSLVTASHITCISPEPSRTFGHCLGRLGFNKLESSSVGHKSLSPKDPLA